MTYITFSTLSGTATVMRFADRTSTNGTLTAYRSIRELGLTEHVTVVAGQEHRWLAYVARRYRSGRHVAKLPLVVAFHGRNGSARYLAQQTQWADVAEARGLVLVFPSSTRMSRHPCPVTAFIDVRATGRVTSAVPGSGGSSPTSGSAEPARGGYR